MIRIVFNSIITGLFIFITSCHSGPKEKLTGKWVSSSFEIVNLEETLNEGIANVPDSLKDSLRTLMSNEIMNSAKSFKNGSFIMNLNENMTYTTSSITPVGDRSESGTWELSEDGKKLTTHPDKTKQVITFEISELTDQNLTIVNKETKTIIKIGLAKGN